MPTTPEIAAAVAQELLGADLGADVAVERAYLALRELRDAEDTTRITVMAASRTLAAASRTQIQIDHRIEVGVQRRLASDDLDAVDAQLALALRICAFLTGRQLVRASEARWVKTEHAPLVAHEHLIELRQFTSVIAVTYRTWEAA